MSAGNVVVAVVAAVVVLATYLVAFACLRAASRADDQEASLYGREEAVMPTVAKCTQCGQRTPVCIECGDTVIFVPKAGFGRTGEWQHLAPVRRVKTHLAAPKVFVS
jgi:hypothetical protein